MRCKVGQYNKTSTPYSTFIVTPSLEGWPPKAKLPMGMDTNPVFQCVRDNLQRVEEMKNNFLAIAYHPQEWS